MYVYKNIILSDTFISHAKAFGASISLCSRMTSVRHDEKALALKEHTNHDPHRNHGIICEDDEDDDAIYQNSFANKVVLLNVLNQ